MPKVGAPAKINQHATPGRKNRPLSGFQILELLVFSVSWSSADRKKVKNCSTEKARAMGDKTISRSSSFSGATDYLLPSSPHPISGLLWCAPPLPVSLHFDNSHPYTVAVGPVTFSSIRRSLKGLSWKESEDKSFFLYRCPGRELPLPSCF